MASSFPVVTTKQNRTLPLLKSIIDFNRYFKLPIRLFEVLNLQHRLEHGLLHIVIPDVWAEIKLIMISGNIRSFFN